MVAPKCARIGFNAALFAPRSPTYRAAGIHRYIAALVGALAVHEDIRIVALGVGDGARTALPAAVEVSGAPGWTRRPVGRIAWEQLLLPSAAARCRVDLYHGAAYAMPARCPWPAVVTVHDLSFFRMPHTLPRAQAFYLRAATRLSAHRAAALIAVSRFTAGELCALLGVSSEKVHVVHNGRDPAMVRPADDRLHDYRARTGLPGRFILTVGTLQPRKNLGVILEAYAVLARRAGDIPPLVVSGAPGWGDTDIAAAARRLGIERQVRVTGFVAAEDLPALYAAATVFAYPSRYEGFGLPVIEAMACGTPVVASRAGSLPEVCGDAALLIDPDDVDGWASAMAGLLADEPERARWAAAGLVRSAAFDWSRSAAETLSVYRTVLGSAAAPAAAGGARQHRG